MKHIASKILLLLFLSAASIMGCHAQEKKSLTVKKVECAIPSAEAVPALLDKNGIAFQPIGVANWKDYPYKPEASFRIAHTGREILLHYRVTENGTRAVAAEDNGPVWQDACVEFFVSPEGNDCYYNFECNCIGTLLIQAGRVNQERPLAGQDVLDKVKRWASLGHRTFDARTGECSWEVAMVIPVEAFFKHSPEPLDGKTMTGNFYKCGDKLPVPHFLSWNPVGTPKPLFHCPEYFGTLHFE